MPRHTSPANVPATVALVLELAAILLGAVTGWLGGELVDRLGVGVDNGANLNAPKTLSGEPAHPSVAGAEEDYRTRPIPHTRSKQVAQRTVWLS